MKAWLQVNNKCSECLQGQAPITLGRSCLRKMEMEQMAKKESKLKGASAVEVNREGRYNKMVCWGLKRNNLKIEGCKCGKLELVLIFLNDF